MRFKAWLPALILCHQSTCLSAAEAPLAQQLKQQAEFWTQRGKTENALDAWRKLLKLEPNHTQALLALLEYEANQGHSDLARAYYARLKSTQATAAQLKLAEAALARSNPARNLQLEEARKLARQGEVEKAIAAYQQAGAAEQLQGDAAAEYLQVLASSKNHYEQALTGIQKLRRSAPNNHAYALLQAKVLTYREASRLQGIAELEQLSRQADVAKAAIDAWRETLSWMGNNPQTLQQVQRFLQRFPNDSTVRQQLQSLQANAGIAAPATKQEKTSSADQAKASSTSKKAAATASAQADPASRGFALLEKGEVKAAEAIFKAQIKAQPRQATGYGGLGLIRMREEQFIEARKLLRQAHALSQRKADWQPALDEANYWATIADAQAAFEDSETEKGIGLLKQALQLNPKGTVAMLQLADALRAENDSKGAEQYFRQVLELDPKNIGAMDGLIGILALQKRISELDQLAPRMSDRQLAVLANVKASQAWERAKDQEKAGDYAAARSSLEQAILLTPENTWIRMDLARLFIKDQHPELAIALMNALSEVQNPQAEALYARALLSAQLERWYECLQILERLPKLARQNESYALQKRAWLRVQLNRYQSLLALGRANEAQRLLKEIEQAGASELEFVGTIALYYVQAAQAEYGVKLMQDFMKKSGQDNVSVLLQYAIILLRLNRNDELQKVIEQIAAMKLTKEEQSQFNDLRGVYALQQAELARNQGDLGLAYSYLQPFLLSDPEHPLLLLALSQLYHSAGDDAASLEFYQQVAEGGYQQTEVIQALVYAGIANRDYETAQQNLEILLQRQTADAALLTLAGQLARARGNPDQALAYFKQALAMQQAARGANQDLTPSTRIPATPRKASGLRDFSHNPFDQSRKLPAPNEPAQPEHKEPTLPLLRKVKLAI